MRDTGWQTGDQYDTGYTRRTIEEFTLTATRNRWIVHVVKSNGCDFTRLAGGSSANRDDAKRAAESALRALCRDTLAALGDGP